MGKCTKMRCPMQYNIVPDDCDIKDCPYRTEQTDSMTISMEDLTKMFVKIMQPTINMLIEQTKNKTIKEIFGELIKSTSLCEPQGGHCSLDYLVVKARQYGLEYVGLDKDGNVLWAGDIIKEETK